MMALTKFPGVDFSGMTRMAVMPVHLQHALTMLHAQCELDGSSTMPQPIKAIKEYEFRAAHWKIFDITQQVCLSSHHLSINSS